jgi:hypothetical protein
LGLLAAALIGFGPATSVAPALADGTGGGCSDSDKSTFGSRDANAAYAACVSLGAPYPQQIVPDAYITWTSADPNLWSSCKLTIRLRDDTERATIVNHTFDCTQWARSNTYNMHYKPQEEPDATPGHAYHTYIWWSGVYDGQLIEGGIANSPEQYVE